MINRTLNNISERDFIADLFMEFKPPLRMSNIEWGKLRRSITREETSFGIGQFDPNLTPYMEYLYDCLDNPYIPVIVSQKSARIAWTETINTDLGKRIECSPTPMMIGFPTKEAARTFGSKKFRNFIKNIPALKKLINVGVAKNKESMFHYDFPGGDLRLVTLGSISNQKSDNIPYINIEEPDDARDDVNGQGDSFANLEERQKTVPKTLRKFIFGGTPTIKDFSRVEKAVKRSNMMVFKACCHVCENLVSMDGDCFENLTCDEYQDMRIDEVYGKHNPETARFSCPFCESDWTFEQKNKNIIKGKEFGFTDHTGNFSKGWHPKYPERTDIFGFIFSELMSPFEDGSSYIQIMKSKLIADLEFQKGNEAPKKSFYNNKRGQPYAGGYSALETEEMIKLRKNYEEGLVHYEGLLVTMGIDVQHNRFAIVKLAHGRNRKKFLVEWKEIFGNVLNWEDPVWRELTEEILKGCIHVTGKPMPIDCVSIDSGDGNTVELVYRWVKAMNELYQKRESPAIVLATKGTRELKYSTNEIYKEPVDTEVSTESKERQTLAATLGVIVYSLGAHRCHDEILRNICLNRNPEIQSDVFIFCETKYGGFEEQMTSCRKIIDTKGNSTKEIYKLIPGQRKEAIDACKNAYHASYHLRIREFTEAHWKALEDYYYE